MDKEHTMLHHWLVCSIYSAVSIAASGDWPGYKGLGENFRHEEVALGISNVQVVFRP